MSKSKLLSKGETKEPQSGPTPGGNNIQIEISEREDQDVTTKFFSAEAPEVPLITVEKSSFSAPCTRSRSIRVTITEPGSEDLSCQKRESRVEKKGPPGYQESKDVTGDPLAVKAKLTEIATLLEKSESLTEFLDLFPSAFEIRGLLDSEADPTAKKMPKSMAE
ncbi:unnamed protein product [Effrenium voratum]|nr:unnamed protein product [Effrenium voratum]